MFDGDDDGRHTYSNSIRVKIPKELIDAVPSIFLLGSAAAAEFLEFPVLFKVYDVALDNYGDGRILDFEIENIRGLISEAIDAGDKLIKTLNDIVLG